MIHVFLGTKAQLIKMAPVMRELQDREIDYNFIFSGQHQATVDDIREEFGIKAPDITLYEGKDITGILQMAWWSLRLIVETLRNREKLWQGDKGGVVLVHGDTFSTLLGAILARLSGQKAAHVESGLRSFNLFHPFPEEITRLLTFRLCQIYFAPGDWAVANLEKYRGEKINTIHNTLLDALRLSESAVAGADIDLPDTPYGLVSIHRFENIFSKAKLTEIVELLVRASETTPLVFILHKPTEKKLAQFGLRSRLESCPGIELRPRYSYFQFIKLVRQSSFVITDGGSNQEECHYLAKPCIIMRSATERQEGIGGNAVVCNYDFERMMQVIEHLTEYSLPPEQFSTSPSMIIVNTLQQ